MPGEMPEIPAPFGKKKGQKDESEFEVPKRSYGYKEKFEKYEEKRKVDIKETAKGFAKSLGLLAGAETVAALGGGPIEAVALGGFLAPTLKPHVIYKKKVEEVI